MSKDRLKVYHTKNHSLMFINHEHCRGQHHEGAEDLRISIDMLSQIDKTSTLTCRRQVNLQSRPHQPGSVLGLTMYSQYTGPTGGIIQSHGTLFHFLLMIAKYISKQIQTTLNNRWNASRKMNPV